MNINNSRAKTFHNCPRRYFWLYEFDGGGLEYDRSLGLTEGMRKMAIGSIVHAGLAALYSDCSLDESIQQAHDCFRKEVPHIPPEEQDEWDDALDMTDRMLEEYFHKQMPLDDFSPIVENIETEFRVALGENCYNCGWEYGKSYEVGFGKVKPHEGAGICPKCLSPLHHLVGRIDLPINQDGTLLVMDHKTAGSVSDLSLEAWHYSYQLIGYVYGYGKAMGANVGGYMVNILRKLKTIGTEKRTHKVCPDCRNGVKKKQSCDTCHTTGKVTRAPEKVTSPFQRERESVGQDDIDRFVHNRIQTVRKILHERLVYNTDPKDSWPMNTEQCFSYGRCPFVTVCHSTKVEKWFQPSWQHLGNFIPRKPDYVDTDQMIKEEVS